MNGVAVPLGICIIVQETMNSHRCNRAATSATSSVVAVVDRRRPPHRYQHVVNRTVVLGHPGRLGICHRVAAENRDVPLLQPGQHRRMQAGGLAAVIPWAFCLTPRPPTGPEEHRIAAANGDSRELFPRFEILHIQRLTLLEVRAPP